MSDPARDLRNVARCYAGNSVRPLVGHNDGACADSALSPARKLAFVDHFVSASNTSAIMSRHRRLAIAQQSRQSEDRR
jgi:hypothetical protein